MEYPLNLNILNHQKISVFVSDTEIESCTFIFFAYLNKNTVFTWIERHRNNLSVNIRSVGSCMCMYFYTVYPYLTLVIQVKTEFYLPFIWGKYSCISISNTPIDIIVKVDITVKYIICYIFANSLLHLFHRILSLYQSSVSFLRYTLY